jgi:hypothetical protein
MSLFAIGDAVEFDGNRIDHVRRLTIETAIPDDLEASGGGGLPEPKPVHVKTTIERNLAAVFSTLALPGLSGEFAVEVARGRTDAHRQRISFDTEAQSLVIIFDAVSGAKEIIKFETVTNVDDIGDLFTIEPIEV